jgi:squalene-hopene/tetraprenyl-beta-curcumene cyclase
MKAHSSMAAIKENLISAIDKGIEYIIDQNNKGYPESIHQLCLPCMNTHGITYQLYSTFLFQRMLIIDSLLDCAQQKFFKNKINKNLIKKEISFIIESKHALVDGGWSYIPNLLLLPPDADDLGLALQILARVGGKELASICNSSLQILFEHCSHKDGSFNTWIVDPANSSHFNRLMFKYIEIIGGRGVHADVVGNLLYGLILFDKEQYKEKIIKGGQYLMSCQHKGGFWESKWYWGRYYATFRALYVLNFISSMSEPIIRSIDFVKATQFEDGGWGTRIDGVIDHGVVTGISNSNPLSTSLALLSLSVCKNAVTDIQSHVLGGISYLLKSQLGNGCWAPVPFIKMASKDGIITYSSSTITTSFCLKALARFVQKIR